VSPASSSMVGSALVRSNLSLKRTANGRPPGRASGVLKSKLARPGVLPLPAA
jgi:hypothetical protein